LPGVTEVVPAYATVTVFYDPLLAVQAGAPENNLFDWMTVQVTERLKNPPKMEKSKGRTVEVPVCYEGDFGPDLGLVAKQAKLTPAEVIKIHGKPEYLVYLVGFAPGLSLSRRPAEGTGDAAPCQAADGRAARLGRHRRQADRHLSRGNPGRLEPDRADAAAAVPARGDPPVLLRAGDRVKFRAISREEFAQLEGQP
jgi:inhibitor of KinA